MVSWRSAPPEKTLIRLVTLPVAPWRHWWTFETLTPGPGRLVDYTGSVDNVPELGSETIDLQPVVPPKPKGS